MARVATGTPPNGKENRTASASVSANGNASQRVRATCQPRCLRQVTGEEGDHDRIANRRELEHPSAGRSEPADAERKRERPPTIRMGGHQRSVKCGADQRKRPPTPGRQRCGNERSGPERRRQRWADRR